MSKWSKKNSRKVGSRSHLFPKQRWQGVNEFNNFRDLIGWCVQLRLHILNLSRAKIYLAFGASHVTWIPIYILLLQKLTISHFDSQLDNSLSHVHTASEISPSTTSDTQPKMGTSKNVFIVQIKLVYSSRYQALHGCQNRLTHTGTQV